MQIAIDIDNTLHPYHEHLSQHIKTLGYDIPYAEFHRYAKLEELMSDPVATRNLHDGLQNDETILAAVPYTGAAQVISQWKQKHSISIISHRNESCRNATAEWLSKCGIPFDQIICCGPEKVHHVADHDLLIDDHPKHIVEALILGIEVGTLWHPWLESFLDVPRVAIAHSWQELDSELRARAIL